MPIGKNAIKRISNNGYSNVQTTAPDMENSVVEEKIEVKKEAPKKKEASTTKAKQKTEAPKKALTKKAPTAPKKSMETEPDFSPVKTAEVVTKKADKSKERQGDGYVNLGGELPYYLL